MLNLDYHENGLHTAQLTLGNTHLFSRFAAKPAIISIVPAFAKDRQAVEHFITDIYARSYGARIGVHYPILMSVRDQAGTILAALGFRYAAQEELFLEQYLSAPIDDILQTTRGEITEIGNLASAGGGASLFLFAALSAYLHSHGQHYAVATGTHFLEKRLRTLDLNPQQLAPANPALLLHHDEYWGSYYDTDPHVLAGDIGRGYKRLQRVLGANFTDKRPRLVPRLHYRGQ